MGPTGRALLRARRTRPRDSVDNWRNQRATARPVLRPRPLRGNGVSFLDRGTTGVVGRLLIHIGYHKTGSTWLRHRFFTHEDLNFHVFSRYSHDMAALLH